MARTFQSRVKGCAVKLLARVEQLLDEAPELSTVDLDRLGGVVYDAARVLGVKGAADAAEQQAKTALLIARAGGREAAGPLEISWGEDTHDAAF